MDTAVSATSALGIAAAAAGCSSQDTWLALWGPGIAPHTLGDTFPGILKVFAAAVSAGGKTSLLNLEENQDAISIILSPTHFLFLDIDFSQFFSFEIKPTVKSLYKLIKAKPHN